MTESDRRIRPDGPRRSTSGTPRQDWGAAGSQARSGPVAVPVAPDAPVPPRARGHDRAGTRVLRHTRHNETRPLCTTLTGIPRPSLPFGPGPAAVGEFARQHRVAGDVGEAGRPVVHAVVVAAETDVGQAGRLAGVLHVVGDLDYRCLGAGVGVEPALQPGVGWCGEGRRVLLGVPGRVLVGAGCTRPVPGHREAGILTVSGCAAPWDRSPAS